MSISIRGEENWFYGTNKCMGHLLTFLAKQTVLQTLNMEHNELFDAQKDQIRQTMSNSAPDCTIEELD